MESCKNCLHTQTEYCDTCSRCKDQKEDYYEPNITEGCKNCLHYHTERCARCVRNERITEDYYEPAITLENVLQWEEELERVVLPLKVDESFKEAFSLAKEFALLSVKDLNPLYREYICVYARDDALVSCFKNLMLVEVKCKIPPELQDKSVIRLNEKNLWLYPEPLPWAKHPIAEFCPVDRQIALTEAGFESTHNPYEDTTYLVLPELRVLLNKSYLEKIISLLDGDCEVSYCSDPHKAVVFTKENIRVALMPMRQ